MAHPHYLLFCDAQAHRDHCLTQESPSSGRWRFSLEQLDGSQKLEATDSESDANSDRLALISVVRGLEALEQPSKVTLITTSRYVSRGLRYGLTSWRDSGYKWERFGVQMPIRNADLWQRIDGAMNFHGVNCRLLQTSDSPEAEPSAMGADQPAEEGLMEEAQTQSALVQKPVNFQPNHTHVQSAASDDTPLPAGLSAPETWWKLAAAWIKWWRQRSQFRPVLSGI